MNLISPSENYIQGILLAIVQLLYPYKKKYNPVPKFNYTLSNCFIQLNIITTLMSQTIMTTTHTEIECHQVMLQAQDVLSKV